MTRILLILSLAICFNAFSQAPSYEAVINYMHENIDVNPKDGIFEIEKRAEGYILYTSYYYAKKPLQKFDYQQIWNPITNKFVKPVFENEYGYDKNENSNMISRFSNLWDRRNYIALFTYYGYSGWIDDMKDLLENKNDLSTKELETLASVYSTEANDLIHPGQYGIAGSKNSKYKEAGYGKLDAKRVMEYKKTYDKCMATYEKLKQKDPNYTPSIITDLNLKIANEYMHGYFTLKCVQEPALANKYLEKANYSNSFINYAKMLLQGCEKNGILFTNGDSDTYPLWYVQDKLGFRKDVTIINLSLAQTEWYLEYLMDQYGLKSSFTRQEVKANALKYFIFNEEERISFSTWRDEFRAKQKKENVEEEVPNYEWINGSWTLKRGSDSMLINRTEQYAFAYQVFLYDVIASNPEREIYAVNVVSFRELGLGNYCTYSGQLLKMQPTLQSSYNTNVDELKIIDAIKDIPEGYFAGLGNWHFNQRVVYLYLTFMISSEKADVVVPLVEKKILSDLAKEKANPYLANSINIFYAHFNVQKQETFKKEYNSEAVNFVVNFLFKPNTIYDDLEELYDIVSIYTSLTRYKMYTPIEEEVTWSGSETLHNNLKTKLVEINEMCEKEYLKTSAAKISTLLSILNACE